MKSKADNTESVTVRVNKSQRSKLERIAANNNRTVSGQVREMIDRADENTSR